MDCIHTRMLIVLDGRDPKELDAAARTALEQHLEQCADCLAWSHQESRVDETLGRAVQAVPVPAQLKTKIERTLRRQPRPRRPVVWVSSAAACLLIAFGITGYFWAQQRPVLQVVDIADDAGYVVEKSPEAVEAWFEGQNVAIAVPREFNYDLLNSCTLTTLKGRRVPRLEFFHRGDGDAAAAVAHVYVVSEERFDVQELVDSVQSPTPANNHVIELVRFGDKAGFVFIAVYTGGSLRPFYVHVRIVT